MTKKSDLGRMREREVGERRILSRERMRRQKIEAGFQNVTG